MPDSLQNILAEVLQEEEHFRDCPEEYPFYVMTFEGNKGIYQFGIFNEPRAWRSGSHLSRYRAFFTVEHGQDAAKVRLIADDFCRRVNVAEGRGMVPCQQAGN